MRAGASELQRFEQTSRPTIRNKVDFEDNTKLNRVMKIKRVFFIYFYFQLKCIYLEKNITLYFFSLQL